MVPRRPPLVVQRDAKGSGYALLQVTGTSAVDRATEQDLPFGVAPPVDLPFLLSLLGLSSFDLIRMDIEGSEMEVLSPEAKYAPGTYTIRTSCAVGAELAALQSSHSAICAVPPSDAPAGQPS